MKMCAKSRHHGECWLGVQEEQAMALAAAAAAQQAQQQAEQRMERELKRHAQVCAMYRSALQLGRVVPRMIFGCSL